MHLARQRARLLHRVRQQTGTLPTLRNLGAPPRKGCSYRARLVVECLEDRTLLSGYQYLVDPPVNISRAQLGALIGSGTIVVDPTNADHLFAAADFFIGAAAVQPWSYYSIDGGNTWQRSDVSNIPGLSGRAKAVADPFGNLFVAYLGATPPNGLVVASSTDFGRTFAGFTIPLQLQNVSPAIAVGGSNVPGESTVWVFGNPNLGNQLFASGARIFGLGQIDSFSTPQEVLLGGHSTYLDTKVGPEGEVMVTYEAGSPTGSIFVNVNPDGLGGTFGPPMTVTLTNAGANASIPASPHFGVTASQHLAWDYARGRVYIVYVDRPSISSADTDIYLRYSDNQGVTWSDRLRVNDDVTTNSQFNPAIAVDPTTGTVAVTWMDARNVPTNDAAEVWAAVSVDGGASFLPNVKVSPGPIDARNFFTEYNSIVTMDFSGGIFYRTWYDNSAALPDNPNGLWNLATARVQVGTPAGPYVTLTEPRGIVAPGVVNHVRVTFSEPMDVNSFTVDTIQSLTGPDGPIAVNAVAVVPDTNDTQFDVNFAPQVHTGRYKMVLGPGILNQAETPMDQDFDGVPGEKTDTYTAQFAVSSFKVAGHTPNDYRFGPVSSVRVTFNRPVNSATFTTDQVISFTGPSGDIAVQHVSAVPGSGNRVFAVAFAQQTTGGIYTLVLGPGIRDTFGNQLDQNEDLVPGEDPDDRYTATFRLADPCLGPDGGGFTACVAPFADYSIFGQPGAFTIIQGPVSDATAAVNLGTNTFTFYGTTYTGDRQLFVNTHGLITFGSGNSSGSNTDLANSPAQAAIAVLWDGWQKTEAEPMVLGRFEDFDEGNVPHTLIIEWYQVRWFGSSPRAITFQAVLTLNEGSATHFTFNYFDLDTGDSTAFGTLSTVGIKAAGPQGPNRLLVVFGDSGRNPRSPFVDSQRAILFSSDGASSGGAVFDATLLVLDPRSAESHSLPSAPAAARRAALTFLPDRAIDYLFALHRLRPAPADVFQAVSHGSVSTMWDENFVPHAWLVMHMWDPNFA